MARRRRLAASNTSPVKPCLPSLWPGGVGTVRSPLGAHLLSLLLGSLSAMGALEAPSDPNPNSNNNKSSVCQECGSNPWKYRCPGCSILTCSLPCVKSHKESTSCTGKRNRTEFVPLSQFNDNHLLSDLRLFGGDEEGGRIGASGDHWVRQQLQIPSADEASNAPERGLPTEDSIAGPPTRHVQEREKPLSVKSEEELYLLDCGVEVSLNRCCPNGPCVDEHKSLSSIIEKHLAPSPWNNQLKPFCDTGLDDLKFFPWKNAKGIKSPYRKLNTRVPIGQQFGGTVIVEYPVIHVFLPSQSYDIEVEKDANLFSKNVETLISACGISSPKGTLFREEKIEEGEMLSDTQVVDLMDYRNSKSCPYPQIARDGTLAVEEDNRQDKQLQGEVAKNLEPFPSEKHQATSEGTNAHLNGAISKKLSEDNKFDFEQEVKDAYSDLIGLINPDDFLCFDGGYNGQHEEIRDNPPYFGDHLFRDEELDEGEIPSY